MSEDTGSDDNSSSGAERPDYHDGSNSVRRNLAEADRLYHNAESWDDDLATEQALLDTLSTLRQVKGGVEQQISRVENELAERTQNANTGRWLVWYENDLLDPIGVKAEGRETAQSIGRKARDEPVTAVVGVDEGAPELDSLGDNELSTADDPTRFIRAVESGADQ